MKRSMNEEGRKGRERGSSLEYQIHLNPKWK
jgi:hypothetical protein